MGLSEVKSRLILIRFIWFNSVGKQTCFLSGFVIDQTLDQTEVGQLSATGWAK